MESGRYWKLSEVDVGLNVAEESGLVSLELDLVEEEFILFEMCRVDFETLCSFFGCDCGPDAGPAMEGTNGSRQEESCRGNGDGGDGNLLEKWGELIGGCVLAGKSGEDDTCGDERILFIK